MARWNKGNPAHNRSTPDKFMAKVNKTDSCWLWTGGTNHIGYGIVGYHGKAYKAHRLSWTINVGPIPDGLKVLHRCDVRNCVRPDHLFLGTQDDNMKDCATKGRIVSVPRYGEQNARSKMTADGVRKMREIYARGGIGQKNLGKMFGVTAMTVNRIVRGQLWKQI